VFVIYIFQTERDVSVRQRAVDLLYAMCDRGNVQTIVAEMLRYLESADYAIREEMVCLSAFSFLSSIVKHLFLFIRKFLHMKNDVLS